MPRKAPHFIYCRIWRWADLQTISELRSVPHCQYGGNASASSCKPSKHGHDDSTVCVNPYHYTRPLTVYVPKASIVECQPEYKDEYVMQPLKEGAGGMAIAAPTTAAFASLDSAAGLGQVTTADELIQNTNLIPLTDALSSPTSVYSAMSSPVATMPLSNSPPLMSDSIGGGSIYSNGSVYSPLSVNSQMSSPASQLMSQALSPRISEDDFSEISELNDVNDFSRSPINGKIA